MDYLFLDSSGGLLETADSLTPDQAYTLATTLAAQYQTAVTITLLVAKVERPHCPYCGEAAELKQGQLFCPACQRIDREAADLAIEF